MLTAGAVGAALLVTPGTVAAQDDIDCSALGDNPLEDDIETAFEVASTCDVEVRFGTRASPHQTVYATPDGRFHQVSTAAAAQENLDEGLYDPTLVLRDGSLTQSKSEWDFQLRHDVPEDPLFAAAGAVLHWNGAAPVPTYSGTTADYDELGAGLDLTVDLGVSSASLAFTADDLAAWEQLATGITVTDDENQQVAWTLRVSDERLVYNGNTGGRLYFSVTTTPFTVRDAASAFTPVDLSMNEEGALTFALPAGTLDSAQFPLTLSTQWSHHPLPVSRWGAVTSAAPDLAVYGGRGGTESPYFQAAGQEATAVVGTYCDAIAEPQCAATDTASSFWSLFGPQFYYVMPSGIDTELPVESATFRVDAADGSACVAPALDLTEDYSDISDWNGRPAAIRSAGTGECQDGSAVYDVTEAVNEEWAGEYNGSWVTFGMLESSEPARFDGASARLDVYYDAFGTDYTSPAVCGNSAAPDFVATGTPAYGGFELETWPPISPRPEFTWTATFTDADTGSTLLTTDAHEGVQGSNPLQQFPDQHELADGEYIVQYEITTADGSFSRPEPCHLIVDTVAPEILGYSVAPETYERDSATVLTIDLEVADAGFPDGKNKLTVNCDCAYRAVDVLTDQTTATFELDTYRHYYSLEIEVDDAAGNSVGTTLHVNNTFTNRDYDGDGREDLVTVRKSDGSLTFYQSEGDGTFADGSSLGSGWGGMDVVMAGDLTGDGDPDLLARDNRTGDLYTYPGDGAGDFPETDRMRVGSNWNTIGAFTSGGDFDSDGTIDLLGISGSDGTLYFYSGRGDGTFRSRVAVGTGWGEYDQITTLDSISSDGQYDLLAHSRADDFYTVYYGDGAAGFDYRTGWSASHGDDWVSFTQAVSVGDPDRDGHEEIAGIEASTGQLVTMSFNHAGFVVDEGNQAEAYWGSQRLPSATAGDPTYDWRREYSEPPANDIVASGSSDGGLYVYPGDGDGGFSSRFHLGSGWNSMDLIETAGDLNGDGFSDLLARDEDSTRMYVYPGDGHGYSSDDRIAWGTWSSMSTVISGHDYNSDGNNDVIAVERSTGYLWLYPGTGDGHLQTRELIGSGWNSMRDLAAVGDLDHDGHADLIAITKSTDCMYFYAGKGNGLFNSRDRIGCGWDDYDQISSIGDFDNDGHTDWIARRTTDGDLYLYQGSGTGSSLGRQQIGYLWNTMNIIA